MTLQRNQLRFWVGPLAIFILAFIVRLPNLGSFVTIDEPRWIEHSRWFMAGLLYPDHECPVVKPNGRDFDTQGWGCTFQLGYPGVTTMWLGGLGLLSYYFFAPSYPNVDLEGSLKTSLTGNLDPMLVAWLRFPSVVVAALFISLFYILLRKLFSERLAIVAALLVALSPFHIALSRVLHHDALTTTFMVLPILAMSGYWLKGWHRSWLIFSAILGGFCLLTKSVSWFLPPFIVVLGVLTWFYRSKFEGIRPNRGFDNALLNNENEIMGGHPPSPPACGAVFGRVRPNRGSDNALLNNENENMGETPSVPRTGSSIPACGTIFSGEPDEGGLRQVAKDCLVWSGIAGLTFVLFFPAMWVMPWRVIHDIVEINFALAQQGHSQYFLGSVSENPGILFYPMGWLFQTSFLELLGLIALPIVIWRSGLLSPGVIRQHIIARPVEVALLLFLTLFLLFETASDKKMVRYFLPAFPIIAIFITMSLLTIFNWGVNKFQKMLPTPKRFHTYPPSVVFLASLIFLIQGWFVWVFHPYHFTYYNPLLGGPAAATRLMTVGWGEGVEQAARYLNALPDASTLVVSSWYSDIFQPYFVGQDASFSDDGRGQLSADYVVFYVNQVQRQKPNLGLIRYFRQKEPIFKVEVDGGLEGLQKATWVEVYTAPAAQSASGAPKIDGVAQLLAYKITSKKTKESGSADVGSNSPLTTLDTTLYLRVLGPLPNQTTFRVGLMPNDNPDETMWGAWETTSINGTWQQDQIVEWHGQLTLPSDLPYADFKPRVIFQFKDDTAIAEFAISEKDPVITIR